MLKKISRLRRARSSRLRIKELGVYRLCVHRTPRHIYAQVINASGRVVVSSSTLDHQVRELLATKTGNVDAAVVVGRSIAEKAKRFGVSKVAFDRSGFRYHGRVKALADSAREAGLVF